MLLQHECDHLDGILYPMRMTDMSTLAFNSELGEKGFLIPRDSKEFSDGGHTMVERGMDYVVRTVNAAL